MSDLKAALEEWAAFYNLDLDDFSDGKACGRKEMLALLWPVIAQTERIGDLVLQECLDNLRKELEK